MMCKKTYLILISIIILGLILEYIADKTHSFDDALGIISSILAFIVLIIIVSINLTRFIFNRFQLTEKTKLIIIGLFGLCFVIILPFAFVFTINPEPLMYYFGVLTIISIIAISIFSIKLKRMMMIIGSVIIFNTTHFFTLILLTDSYCSNIGATECGFLEFLGELLFIAMFTVFISLFIFSYRLIIRRKNKISHIFDVK